MTTFAIILIVLGFIFTILAIGGSVLPILPGPPLGVLGVLLLDLADDRFIITWPVWVILILLMFIGVIVDYLIPALMVKFFGGTKKGSAGSTVGQVVGLYWGLIGSITGAFLGTVLGEKISKKNWKESLKSGVGSTVGFLISSVIKIIISIGIMIVFLVVLLKGL